MHHGQLSSDLAKGIQYIRGLIEKAAIPPSKLDEQIIVGTWNIREFGKKARLKAARHYIAEIISQFDLIALTEVRDDLDDLKKVMEILGPYWHVVYSDFRTDDAGNRERIAYVFDKRAVVFTGLAAEADPPRTKNKQTGEYENQHEDWWRSPYMVSFRAGNFDFTVITAHVRWGSGATSRAKALQALADWVDDRRNDEHARNRDIIVMGDMNTGSRRSTTYKALTSKGLMVPAAITNQKTNLGQTERFDHILHDPTNAERFTGKGGIIKFSYEDRVPLFGEAMTEKRFTFQMSDHLPLWMAVDVWIEDEQIKALIEG